MDEANYVPLRCVIPVVCVTRWEGEGSSKQQSSLPTSYVHLFGPPQKHRASKWFETDTDVKQAVTSWLRTPDTNFFCAMTQVFMLQWDIFLNANSHYVAIW